MMARIGQILLSWLSRKVLAMLMDDLLNIFSDWQAGREQRVRMEEQRKLAEENQRKFDEAQSAEERAKRAEDLLNRTSNPY